ncbi:uncharacterized protein LY79DRAFT_221600 [Colletotrichum navitas]|uniref:Uncharacterized protein n=1 Tax=Colletotrichum navitas TaxID=681940 RepID=A0AAD8PYK7_9PEZI|nr:uncharacterized protein LY79DRAFT_221600 [Colletotrichum navitas]KAK1590331.1 hypothetical protein LY79DRAFT_221600 [Colletotrichum navitas]
MGREGEERRRGNNDHLINQSINQSIVVAVAMTVAGDVAVAFFIEIEIEHHLSPRLSLSLSLNFSESLSLPLYLPLPHFSSPITIIKATLPTPPPHHGLLPGGLDPRPDEERHTGRVFNSSADHSSLTHTSRLSQSIGCGDPLNLTLYLVRCWQSLERGKVSIAGKSPVPPSTHP